MEKILNIKEIEEQIEEIENDWMKGKIVCVVCLNEEKKGICVLHNIYNNICSFSCFKSYNNTHIFLNINNQIHIPVAFIKIEYKENEGEI